MLLGWILYLLQKLCSCAVQLNITCSMLYMSKHLKEDTVGIVKVFDCKSHIKNRLVCCDFLFRVALTSWSLLLLTEVHVMWSVKCVQRSQMLLCAIGSDSHVIKGRVQPLLPCSLSLTWVWQFFELMLVVLLHIVLRWTYFLPVVTTEEPLYMNFWCKKESLFCD